MDTFSYFNNAVYAGDKRLDPWAWRWEAASLPQDAEPITAFEALRRLNATGAARRLPIGVIGPREATPGQLEAAEAVGRGLGEMGLTMICGGKSGVMEAAAKGCLAAGGLPVGLVPDHDWRAANAFIALPIATGLSEARNMIIAKSCLALIAVGGSYGTLSEIAYGLHFSKPVIGLAGAPDIEGMEQVDDAQAAVARAAHHLLAAAHMS